MTFLENGHGERLKGAVHAVIGVGSVCCWGYNVLAMCQRREGHLMRNSLVYLSLTAYEVLKVRHHWSRL
jgi:hypothetical protein